MSLLASLGSAGLGPGLQVEGAIDRDAFETFIEHHLVPILEPGHIVVLDNLSVHKSARARDLIEAAGAELWFLPTYSPDFNPIEQAFSKLKHHLRQAAADTREHRPSRNAPVVAHHHRGQCPCLLHRCRVQLMRTALIENP